MINEFLQYLQYEKNYSSHTVLSYRTDLCQFCLFLQIEQSLFNPDSISASQIQQWVLFLLENKISARTLSRKISTLKSFWHFLLGRGLTKQNPTLKIILPKTNKALPAFFKQKEMEAALDDAFLPDNFEALRNHTIIATFYMTGIRRSELVDIKDVDVDLSEGTIKVTGKRNKQRIIPISKQFCLKIEQYITKRNNEITDRSNYLFVRQNGQPLYPKMVYNIITGAMSGFGSLHKKSPHVLRHTFATGLLNEGADINAVKELLGHSSLAATQVYTHTSFDELHNIYKQAHPRAK